MNRNLQGLTLHSTPQMRTAFTLIELLVVIAILAIIAAILFPVFARTREKSRQAACLSNLKQIALAVQMYTGDYDETFPFVLNFSANDVPEGNFGDGGKKPRVPGKTGQEPEFQLVHVVASYVKNQNVWYCPSVGQDYTWEAMVKIGNWKKGATMRDQGTTYGYTYIAFPFPYDPRQLIFMGDKKLSILREPSRWPMLWDEPNGFTFTGNIGDPPTSAAPHSGGVNIAYGDGHTKFFRMKTADGNASVFAHLGDGIFQ